MPVGKKCSIKTVALAVDEKEKTIEITGLRSQGGVSVTWQSSLEIDTQKWATTKQKPPSPKQVPLLGVFYF